MGRELLYSGLVAGMICGCQSARSSSCCDDCVPPKTYSYCQNYWQLKDEYISQATAAKCAHDDLKSLKKSCGKVSADFAEGFRQAYIDLSMGRPALVPTVPPPHYWNAYYRSCAGHDQVADWFEGYQLGLEYGQQGGVSKFNRVVTSSPIDGMCPTGSMSSSGQPQGFGYAAASTTQPTPSLTKPPVPEMSPYMATQDRYGAVAPVNYTAGGPTPRTH